MSPPPPQSRSLPQKRRTSEPLPPGMLAASREVFLGLAEMTRPFGEDPTDNPYTRDRVVLTRIHRALTALFQLEGGRIELDWSHEHLQINHIPIPQDDEISQAQERLIQRYGNRGLQGLVFRLLPELIQIRNVVRRINRLEAHDIEALGAPGQVVPLPDDEATGTLLFVDMRGRSELPPMSGHHSGLGMRFSWDQMLKEQGLDWVGVQPPLPHGAPMSAADAQRFCLGVYTDLVTTSLWILRMAPRLQKREVGLPTLALHRMIRQLVLALHANTGLMQAAMLLGARDASPSRRMAHAVLTSLGMGVELGLDPGTLAQLGLAAFISALRVRLRQLDQGHDHSDWEILQLLGQEQALTPLKVRAVHAAALAGLRRPETVAFPPPESSLIVQLAAEFSALLDGTLNGRLNQAPAPAPMALQDLLQRYKRRQPLWGRTQLRLLARWLGQLPPGTTVHLKDRRTAVICPGPNRRLMGLPLIDASQRIIEQPAAPIPLTREAPTSPDEQRIEGVISPRPLVNLAARALFGEARESWSHVVLSDGHPVDLMDDLAP